MFQSVQAAGQDDAAAVPAGVSAGIGLPSSGRGQPATSFNDLSMTSDLDDRAV